MDSKHKFFLRLSMALYFVAFISLLDGFLILFLFPKQIVGMIILFAAGALLIIAASILLHKSGVYKTLHPEENTNNKIDKKETNVYQGKYGEDYEDNSLIEEKIIDEEEEEEDEIIAMEMADKD